jgi:hypothetical protein
MPYLISGTSIQSVPEDYQPGPGETLAAGEYDPVYQIALEGMHAQVLATNLMQAARAALDASDVQVIRCIEDGQPLPDAWRAYRVQLRSIVSGGPGPLPPRPDWLKMV